jgi:hypothetical protein
VPCSEASEAKQSKFREPVVTAAVVGAIFQAICLGGLALLITSNVDSKRVEQEHDLAGARTYQTRQVEATMSLITLVSRASVHAQELIEVSQGTYLQPTGLDPEEFEALRMQRSEQREQFNSFVHEWRVGKKVVGLTMGYYGVGNDPGDPIAGDRGTVSYEWSQLESSVELYLRFAKEWYVDAPALSQEQTAIHRLQQQDLHDEIQYRLQALAGTLLDDTIPDGLKEAHSAAQIQPAP